MADLLVRTTSSFTVVVRGRGGGRLETTIWTAKLVIVSIGILSTFLLFKVAVIPCLLDFTLSVVPWTLSCFRTWLSPPYIYIIVNFIIISIVASNSYSLKSYQDNPSPTSSKLSVEDEEKNSGGFVDLKQIGKQEEAEEAIEDSFDVISKDVVSFFSTNVVTAGISDIDGEPPQVITSVTSSDVYPYLENSPPEEEDGVDSYDDDDTLDAMWKAIMEGKGTVRKPFLRKSDTWNAHAPPPLVELSNDLDYLSSQKPANYYKAEMRKSETFNDRVRTGGGEARREPLASHDSFNQRVEAFIKKCTNDMRVERQESDLRYLKMVKQGI